MFVCKNLLVDISLIKNNAQVAAQISVELSKLRIGGSGPNRSNKNEVDKRSPVNNLF